MIEQTPLGGGVVELTFRLPAADPPGEVSVVGDFNDWQPGVHQLLPGSDGTREVTVRVSAGIHHFRYLATGGVWRDDDQADVVTPYGSVIYCRDAAPATATAPKVGAGQRPHASTDASEVEAAPARTEAAPASGARTRRTARKTSGKR